MHDLFNIWEEWHNINITMTLPRNLINTSQLRNVSQIYTYANLLPPPKLLISSGPPTTYLLYPFPTGESKFLQLYQ